MIDIKMLKLLIRLMKENELSELDIRDKDEQVTLKRGGGTMPVGVHPGPGVQPLVLPALNAPPAASPPATTASPTADEETGLKITSPMVGTFYSTPSPDAQAFVRVGSRVGPDTVVCVIEAMKVFNEIKAECAGTIIKVLVNSGQAVEFGQPLFLVKPD